jgi:hypothetical protein
MQTIDISCSRGDTASWTVNCRIDNLPIDLTSGSVVMSARRNVASPVVFTRTSADGDGIVIDVDPTTGICVVTLHADDTTGLTNEVIDLIYSIRVTTPAGAWVVAGGKLTVNPIAIQLP